jgi:hypothetical protein
MGDEKICFCSTLDQYSAVITETAGERCECLQWLALGIDASCGEPDRKFERQIGFINAHEGNAGYDGDVHPCIVGDEFLRRRGNPLRLGWEPEPRLYNVSHDEGFRVLRAY